MSMSCRAACIVPTARITCTLSPVRVIADHLFCALPAGAVASLHPGTDPAALPLRGRGIRRHARTHPSTHHRTRDWKSIHGDASLETAHRPRLVAEEARGHTPELFVWRQDCALGFLAGSFL